MADLQGFMIFNAGRIVAISSQSALKDFVMHSFMVFNHILNCRKLRVFSDFLLLETQKTGVASTEIYQR
ncbi:MAG TPA: hypothetical protein VIY48_05210 [Candidatus Paceibacterota bacterium]